MKHNGNTLNTVIDELRADINEGVNVPDDIKNDISVLTLRVKENDDAIEKINSEVANNKNEINELNKEVDTIKVILDDIVDSGNSSDTPIIDILNSMQETITNLQTELANTKAELDELKSKAITSIVTSSLVFIKLITYVQGLSSQFSPPSVKRMMCFLPWTPEKSLFIACLSE
jgi:predicted RNase H-like nuclease (RuvC/YqgF family)